MEPVTPLRRGFEVFEESKSARKFRTPLKSRQKSTTGLDATPTTPYERTPLARVPSRLSLSETALGAGATADDEAAFVALDKDDTGFVTRDQVLGHLHSIRPTLDVEWTDEGFDTFARFHLSAVCIHSDAYSLEDFTTIASVFRVCDNLDYIGTRLFHQSSVVLGDDALRAATQAVRDGMRLLWAKRGEILCAQGSQLDYLLVVYHGSATGVRTTDSGMKQRLVSLAPGTVFGFLEMVVEQAALLTLTMDQDGSVLMLPLAPFRKLLSVDHQLLWDVCYEILTEVHRIYLFMNAAQFPRIASLPAPTLAAAASPRNFTDSATVNSKMSCEEVIARVFKVDTLSPEELREFRFVVLGMGAPLYSKGQKAAAMWVLIDGTLDLPDHLFCVVNGMRVVGELGLLTRQDRARDVLTLSTCTLLRVSLQGLRSLTRANMEVLWMLARPSLARVIQHLASVNVGFEHRVLRSGKDLFRAGEPSTCLYILINGRLRIVDPHDEKSFVVDVSKPGESIGELSLLSGTPHTHNVFAVRDAELLVLDEAAFEAVLQQNPHRHIRNLFRTVRERSVTFGSSKFGHKPSTTKTIAVLSASEAIHVDHFTEMLCSAVQQCGKTVRLITGEMIRARFPSIRKPDDSYFSRGIAYYMANQEENYDCIVCLADNSARSAWTRWLVRQVDLIWVVGYADQDPRPTLEAELNLCANHKGNSPLAEMHLVLVHAPGTAQPSGTAHWLAPRPKIQHHFHVIVDRAVDFQRLARVITGQTVGVVFSGGGARGLAHLGVLRALMELGCPIDAVGGSSMGSQIAGLVAQEMEISEMMRRLEDFYVRGYFRALFWDVSIFPYVALLTGEAFVNRLRRLLGRTLEIEDLWIPYFAVSANLTKRKPLVHRRGPLWRAARASASLPLLLPPMVDAEEGILMDGGLMDNLPVSTARVDMACDIIIAVDVSTPGTLPLMPYTTFVSGLRVLWDVLTRGNSFSSAVEMLLYLSQIVDEGTRDTREKEADVYVRPSVSQFGLLDWDPSTQVQSIQEGHSAALAAFAKLKVDAHSTWSKCTGIVHYAPRLMQEHSLRSRNHWRRVAVLLGFVLTVLAFRRYPLWRILTRRANALLRLGQRALESLVL